MNLDRRHCESLILRNGRVIDPAADTDEITDICIEHGVISLTTSRRAAEIDATGLIVCPGFMDMHVHLREPGQTQKETIATGCAAAAAGGFTGVACMPNTAPPLDRPEAVRRVIKRAREVDLCRVDVVACITRDRAGRGLVDFAALQAVGACAFSDDGAGVDDDEVMRSAFQVASRHNALLIQHCEYKALSAGGVMHLGDVSRRLHLPGLDPRSEEAMIERDIGLARQFGARYHVAHISTARAVDMVRRARAEGVHVTAEVCPHHLLLTDEACCEADPNTKMHPPLRPWPDVEACRRGLLDGTIDCIVTDHAPHLAREKAEGFLKAPPGIVGLETAVGVAGVAMIETGLAEWRQLVEWFTLGPARVLGRSLPRLTPGQTADITLIDPENVYRVDPAAFRSKSRNTPFAGQELRCRGIGTIRGQKVVLLPEGQIKLRA